MKQLLFILCGLLIACVNRPKPKHVAYVNQAFDSIRVRSVRQNFNFDSLEQILPPVAYTFSVIIGCEKRANEVEFTAGIDLGYGFTITEIWHIENNRNLR